MHSQDLRAEQEAALRAVLEAAKLCQEVQSNIATGVLEKADRSPVTVADFGSQALVCKVLSEAFPNDPVVGEESADALRENENSELLSKVVGHVQSYVSNASTEDVLGWIDRGGDDARGSRFWTLDPIDGTKGFLRGEQYAIALALIIDGVVSVAAICCPNLSSEEGTEQSGVVYGATKGRGLIAMTLDGGILSKASTSPERNITDARFCESVESGHSSHGDAEEVAKTLGISRPSVRLDSQAKYAVVARGEAEFYMRLPTRPGYVERIWDHAGGLLIVEEAGGTVTDVDGKPLDFAHGRGLENNRGVVASNGILHDRIIEALVTVGVGSAA